jgi:chromosome segregation ATPase
MARVEMVVLPASTATCSKSISGNEPTPVKVTFSSIEDLADVLFASNENVTQLPGNNETFVSHIKDGMQQHTMFLKNIGSSLKDHADCVKTLKDCEIRHWRKIEQNENQMQCLQKDNLDNKQQVLSIKRQIGDLEQKMANPNKMTSEQLRENRDNINELKGMLERHVEDTELLDNKFYVQQHRLFTMDERMENLKTQIDNISTQNLNEKEIKELKQGLIAQAQTLDSFYNKMETHTQMHHEHRQSVQNLSKTIESSARQQEQNYTKVGEQLCKVKNNVQNLLNSAEHDKKLRDLETEMARTQAQVQSVYARTGNEVQLCPPRSRPMKKNSEVSMIR